MYDRPYEASPPPGTSFSHPESHTAYAPLSTRWRDSGTSACQETAQRLTILERDHNDLRRKYAEQQLRLQRMEDRLDALLAARSEAQGSHRNEHLDIARQYTVCVEQRVQSFARTAAPPGGRRDALLCSIGRVCAVLFGPEPPTTGAVLTAVDRARLDPLAGAAAQLCDRANDLRRRAQATGLPFSWDFEFVPGDLLDPAWQEAWPPCDPDLPGLSVVAPAYLVAEQVYTKQRVQTGITVMM
ncbi:hypothetical protein ABZ891_37480 [Streptomyces sp. NPDC047023]|uniref:hypothetical protein n=1 Tax=Streptomyces sp. NPDC047023 TaxID=3155139 RepID=UPI0033FE3C5F